MYGQAVIQIVMSLIVHLLHKVFRFIAGVNMYFFFSQPILRIILVDLVHGAPHRLGYLHKTIPVNTVICCDLTSGCRHSAVLSISE